MAKLISKLYRPDDLLAAINAVEAVLSARNTIEAKDLIIDLRKKGWKLVKVDDGERKGLLNGPNNSTADSQ